MKTVFIDKKEKKCVCTKENKTGLSIYKKGLQLFTNIYKNVHSVTVFMAPPPPSISAFAEDTDSTERSPASKNPNGSSGTCPTGDRPVPRTRSSAKATGSRLDGTLDCP